LPDANVKPSAEKATACTGLPWLSSRRACCPVAVSHRMTWPSLPADASNWPSGEKATDQTRSLCPVNTRGAVLACQFQRHTAPPSLPAATQSPFGENATALKGPRDAFRRARAPCGSDSRCLSPAMLFAFSGSGLLCKGWVSPSSISEARTRRIPSKRGMNISSLGSFFGVCQHLSAGTALRSPAIWPKGAFFLHTGPDQQLVRPFEERNRSAPSVKIDSRS